MLADARRWILAGPRPPAVYQCENAERADERRRQEEAARPWLAAEAELDEYDQQLRDEEAAEFRRASAWVDDLTDDELRELHQQAMAAGAGGDLRAELGQYLARTRPAAAPHVTDILDEVGRLPAPEPRRAPDSSTAGTDEMRHEDRDMPRSSTWRRPPTGCPSTPCSSTRSSAASMTACSLRRMSRGRNDLPVPTDQPALRLVTASSSSARLG
ncbi:hypothetical protein [Streptomyces sp. NPDC016626]|uniref:hypothetical protein n=1 Tax=Streptomyces sp. NPDC016626 TaxID=3364968 RepID=UPI0036FCDC97